jgi:hypothetical protein
LGAMDISGTAAQGRSQIIRVSSYGLRRSRFAGQIFQLPNPLDAVSLLEIGLHASVARSRSMKLLPLALQLSGLDVSLDIQSLSKRRGNFNSVPPSAFC